VAAPFALLFIARGDRLLQLGHLRQRCQPLLAQLFGERSGIPIRFPFGMNELYDGVGLGAL
jgi:hypothetical protein